MKHKVRVTKNIQGQKTPSKKDHDIYVDMVGNEWFWKAGLNGPTRGPFSLEADALDDAANAFGGHAIHGTLGRKYR